MFGPLPWNVHNPSYQMPLSNGLSDARCARERERERRFSNLNVPLILFFFFISFYSSLKRHSYDDDYSLKNSALNELKLKKKQRSSVICPSLVVPKMMHQATTNEAAIGVPSRLCSVCGDISTGNRSLSLPVSFSHSLVRQAFISVATAVKVVKRFFVDRFNVSASRTTNVRAKVGQVVFLFSLRCGERMTRDKRAKKRQRISFSLQNDVL